MTKISRKNLSPDEMGEYINNLWSAFTLAQSKEEIRALFKDLITHTEMKMLAKRLEVSRRVGRGDRYEAIVRDLRVTPGTIAKMSNILVESGQGLRKAIENLERLMEKRMAAERERRKDMENPFRRSIRNHRKTALGQLLKVGAKAVDQKIIHHYKVKSAHKNLDM